MSEVETIYSVLLPTYNEKQNLPITIFLLNEISTKHELSIEVIVIDDNSPDGTATLAQQLAATFNRLRGKDHLKGDSKSANTKRLVKRPGKLGLGSAYREGFKHARGEFVIIMDADLSHHPKYIPVMVEKQKQTNAEVVTGSRYRKGGGVQGWNLMRKIISRGANFLTTFTLGATFSDFTGSFRLYKHNVLQTLMNQTDTSGYAFQMEMVVRAQRMGWRVEQIPIVFVDRIYGKSKLSGKESFIYLKSLAKLFFEA